MKGIKYLTVFIVIAAFVFAGCAREPFEYPTLQEMPDYDNDGIPDQYEIKDNPVTKQVVCKAPDGTVYYLDCTATNDCDCDGVEDSYEKQFVEECGWGCTHPNVRTGVMIGLGLAGGYLLGHYVNWPWPEKGGHTVDVTGQPIEFVEPTSIDYNTSYYKFESNAANSRAGYVVKHVEGTCQQYIIVDGAKAKIQNYKCGYDATYQIDTIEKAWPSNTTVASLNLFENSYLYSHDPNDAKQTFTAWYNDKSNVRTIESFDWLGVPNRYMLQYFPDWLRRTYLWLENRSAVGSANYFMNLYLGIEDGRAEASKFIIANGSIISSGNYFFYTWKRAQ